MPRVSSKKYDDVLTKVNELEADYVSQTDTNEQDIKSDIDMNNKEIKNCPSLTGGTHVSDTVSGTSPITVAHGQGKEPDGVTLGVKAIQVYSVTWWADSTNIYIYHDAVGSLTVSYDAVFS